MKYLLYVVGLIFFNAEAFAGPRDRAGIKDGLVHIGIFGSFAPGANMYFPDYVEGNTASNSILPAHAKFVSDSFSSYGAELTFYTMPMNGFSFGYVVDSPRNIEHMDIDYGASSIRVYKPVKDVFSNTSYTFNYFLRSPERGYLGFGANYSNPKWEFKTPSNSNIELKGGLGFQLSYGFALVKGIIFDVTFRSTALHMKYSDPTTNNFQDFGAGQMGNIMVGFKFIL